MAKLMTKQSLDNPKKAYLKKIVLLRGHVARLKRELRFLLDRYERLSRESAPAATRPEGQVLRCIPKKQLISGRWYLGIGRGSNVAFWDGKGFSYIEEIMGMKSCDHWDDGPPFGCFQPFEEIDGLKFGQVCRYIQDAKSKAKDKAWQREELASPERAGLQSPRHKTTLPKI